MEFGNFPEIQEISGKFRGNSVGFCMALNMNSVGMFGGFRGSAGFSGKPWGWGGFVRFGASKGFCANSQVGVVFNKTNLLHALTAVCAAERAMLLQKP